MAVFAFKGVTGAGKSVKGTRDADNVKALHTLLKREGVFVTEILEEAAAKKQAAREVDFRKLFSRVNTLDIAVATRQLAVLIKAGIPLVEGLTALIDQLEHPDLKEAYTNTRNRVNEGASFADALKAHPKIFEPLYVNMVAAGEASGTLEAVLARLADFLEASAKLKGKVTSALAYPAFMAVMTVFVVIVMMTVVVPKVTGVFADFQQSLPWYTRVLIFMSDAMTNYWWLMLAAAVGAVYWFKRLLATDAGRLRWDTWVLKAPIFGQLILMVSVARFASTLSTLLSSGVQVLHAMEITRNVIGNRRLMEVVETARTSVREGEGLAKPLRESKMFPPIVTHMIAIGERSGQLEEMLQHVASAFDQQIEMRVATMTSLLEPIMIMVMGGITGSIAMAILMPLMQINEFVQ